MRWLILLMLWLPTFAFAKEWPIPTGLSASDEIVIEGVNHKDGSVIVVLRIDDHLSKDYWTRVNEERRVGSGLFTLSMSLAALRTPRGRHLNLDDIQRLIVFDTGEPGQIDIARVYRREAVNFGPSVIALDLGPAGSAVFPGFQAMDEKDPRLVAKSAKVRKRPSGDALVSDGIEGVDRLTLEVENGLWRVALFVQEQGEWEYLPHFLERRIWINDQIVLDEKRNTEQWIEEVYLEGLSSEYQLGQSLFEAVGRRRSGLIDTLVAVENGRIDIALAAPDRAARFLAGVVVTPFSAVDVIGAVQSERAKRLAESWQIATRKQSDAVKQHAITTPGGFVALNLSDVRLAEANYEPPQLGEHSLDLTLRAGQWRLGRPDTAATELVIDDRHLSRDLTVDPMRPRSLWLTGRIPTSASPGIYRGQLAGRNVTVEVLALRTAKPQQSVGIYLDDLPYEAWFDGVHPEQRSCDYALLSAFGLTAIAPPLATPTGDDRGRFQADLLEVQSFDFRGPYLAYTPAKRLAAAVGNDAFPKALTDVDAGSSIPVYWSIADEPHNQGRGYEPLIDLITTIRQINPAVRLAGQFNYEGDDQIASLFDLALVNSGYGLSEARIASLAAHGTKPWLYNMGNPRLAAGFYLWRLGAEGYLQWHGRMPTADPFDPTDGREADVQLLYPSAKPCQGDIDRDLIAIAEGIEDLRWLEWLEDMALRNASASRLLQELRDQIPEDWFDARGLKSQQLEGFRTRITELAQSLL